MRRIAFLLLASFAFALAGCASLRAIDSDVSSFSRWPAGRAPSTYAFERLPSQQAQPQQAADLEDAARRAVEAAGFTLAKEGAAPDVSVQVAARITEVERSPFDDPFWYGARPFPPFIVYGRYGRPFWGPGPGYGYGGWAYDLPRYDREVGVLIRDKATGDPLYEARASSSGASFDVTTLLPAMFSAALADFPRGAAANPHRVSIPKP